MAIEYNPESLKENLLRVYEKFLEDPSDKENLKEIRDLDEKYSPLVSANEYISSKPVKEEIKEAIGFLYNIWSEGFGEAEEEITSGSKKILENLRKI